VIHRWLVPHVVLPLYERFTGRRPWTEALRLREPQWRPREELEAPTLLRLRGVLGHAAMRVPSYRDLFTRAGIAPQDVTTLLALSRLPITTKADLRAGSPDRKLAEGVPAAGRWKSSTSGSTGVPFEFYSDRAVMDSWLASHLFFLDRIGAALWRAQATLAPSGTARPRRDPHLHDIISHTQTPAAPGADASSWCPAGWAVLGSRGAGAPIQKRC
jgi:phenylacetate-CoA ligase